MRRAAKIDINQPVIVSQLRGIPGCSVQLLSPVGQGCPDLLIGWMQHNYLVELKNPDMPPSKRRLTPDEKKWHNAWRGQVDVAETFEDCLRIVGISTDVPPF